MYSDPSVMPKCAGKRCDGAGSVYPTEVLAQVGPITMPVVVYLCGVHKAMAEGKVLAAGA